VLTQPRLAVPRITAWVESEGEKVSQNLVRTITSVATSHHFSGAVLTRCYLAFLGLWVQVRGTRRFYMANFLHGSGRLELLPTKAPAVQILRNSSNIYAVLKQLFCVYSGTIKCLVAVNLPCVWHVSDLHRDRAARFNFIILRFMS